MPYDYDLPFKPIQVLAVACTTLGDGTTRSAWLQGYALLNIQPTRNDVVVTGDVVIGDRCIDDARLVTLLGAALKSDAVLAGLDLTSVVAHLGLLPMTSSISGRRSHCSTRSRRCSAKTPHSMSQSTSSRD